ncbi:PspC domain-containing protein [uncultured Proteiniphilum sp.]|uniref:PspC domain-containing protein n=1 Tax=uncultured Proteiniphilum sp. TaxID=497637 RepID=UPI002601DB48|nr:PspC domain-containing protein [uncultured Proteiniphilum sp.]
MKKVININFQGQVIAIEETAYEILKQYIGSLKIYFSREEGGDEIVNDIECRIAELFGNRLKHGINCITDEDVKAIIDSIGRPQDFDSDYEEATASEQESQSENPGSPKSESWSAGSERQSLYRNASDRIIGGVCSGLAHYFKTDPVWIRILFVLFFGILFWIYIILWIVLKPKELKSNVSKRLYRNPNDRFIGGVCGGIAAYFRIDSWIPRVLFLLPLVLNMVGMISIFPLNRIFEHVGFNWNFNMSMVLIYVVLWAIIPVAKTVKQKLEMMGEEDYIRSIREKVTDNVASSRSRAGNEGTPRPVEKEDVSRFAEVGNDNERPGMEEMPPEPPVSGRRGEVVSRSERSGCLNAFVILLKIIFFSCVGIFLLVLIGIFIGLLVTGTHLLPLKSLFIDPGYETNLLFTSLGLIFLVPVAAVVVWIIRRAMKAKSRPAIGIVASLLWIAGLVMTGILGARIADKFNVESSSERTVSITPVTSGKMYVEMQPYAEDYAELRTFRTVYGVDFGINHEFDELPYTTINEDSLLFDNINIQIGKSSDSLFHVRVISALHGRDLRSAKADISQFSYDIVQKDSVLLLPEFLSVPVNQGFRNQSITVEISVPGGKTIEMSEALRDYKDNRPPAVVRKRIRNYSRNTNYLPVDISEEGEVFMTLSTDSI